MNLHVPVIRVVLATRCDCIAGRGVEEPVMLDGKRCEEHQDDDNAQRRANSAGHDTNYLPWVDL